MSQQEEYEEANKVENCTKEELRIKICAVINLMEEQQAELQEETFQKTIKK